MRDGLVWKDGGTIAAFGFSGSDEAGRLMRSTRPQVAIAACRAFDGATDVYPDPDWPLLSAALVDAGADAIQIPWDHEDVDWQRFDLVVTNSTWDSVDRPLEFRGWAQRTARVTTSMNPLPAIEWNIDKTYLRTLESRGVAIVATEWFADAEGWDPPPYEFRRQALDLRRRPPNRPLPAG